MSDTAYRYSMGMFAADGSPLVQFALETDWLPAIESARLDAVRKGGLPLEGLYAPCEVEPIWHPDTGEPYLCGFRVTVMANGSAPARSEFGITYWKQTAQTAASELVNRGLLQTGDKFLYDICAYRGVAEGEADVDDMEVEELLPEMEPVEASLSDLVSGSVPVAAPADRDMPVFIPREVLVQAMKMKAEAEASEIGSVLIGQLHVDRSVPEVFLVVTAQIPALLAQSELASLTFTPDAWSAVQSALELRHKNEIMCGWFHSHPIKHFSKCEKCGRVQDNLNADFFSADDVVLHRTVFPKAYSVALVLSDRCTTQDQWFDSAAMYGWQRGRIASRGFYMLDSSSPPET